MQHIHAAQEDFQDYIGRATKLLFPDEFEDLKCSADRGRWTIQPPDDLGYEGGIYLNRVTLWKLQCDNHRDRKDYLCAITCSGDFEGGFLLIPDLGLKLRLVFLLYLSLPTVNLTFSNTDTLLET